MRAQSGKPAHHTVPGDPITRLYREHPLLMLPIFFLIGLPIMLVKKLREFWGPKPRG